ncbi:MAG TPA: hypothetical protein VFK59_08225 [Actinomycetota bacterium]|nr:hypothetical protein [Actinomycetota bacterium]
MATRGAALPIERSYLLKAWFAVAAIVIVAAVVVSAALATRSTPAGGTDLPPVKDFGPVSVQYEPTVVSDNVCGQCR